MPPIPIPPPTVTTGRCEWKTDSRGQGKDGTESIHARTPHKPNVHLGFYDRRAEILAAHDAKSLYSDSSSLETSVEFLTSQMDKIREWLRSVPDAMKTNKRKDGGEPFSTDRSRLDLERYAPSWCSANGFSSSFSTTTSL
ncbi:uncharacterized protein NFIA_045450 [Aspergillus fischeri NRRL 181]|uniref:Uncharacterized protein n=1 Tax=Neosartorya fischeri (strain ATCC 1020 / DSM 3700 / CBS 544.65 / FGSC A1164 / JCM 1740 / NRRL 181 / WB 181) TaxID=331117 RepID=A1CVE9_NEOFI|nr:uncharacterized protein NFIA_045450 [Aspergillus fischeri NRRL 181]EAW25726.1 hypothetical protein NFIA_045450 [Aspergillus fischeri NRRL 181]